MEKGRDIFDKLIDSLNLDEFYRFIDERISLDLSSEKLIYHYTNWQSLFNGIIREKDDDDQKVHLYSTNCKYLNDPSEMAFGEKHVDIALERLFGKASDFSDDSHLQSLYLSSFSLEENTLPMWNTYGKMGDGLCIGFDPAIISKGEGYLGRCIYMTPLNHADFLKTLNSNRKEGMVNDGDKFTKYLGYLMDFIKNGCYAYEKEVRFIRSFMGSPDFRLSGNILVPFVDNVYPKEAIKRIIVGPCNDYERSVGALVRWLKKAGMSHVKVSYSTIPFRNR